MLLLAALALPAHGADLAESVRRTVDGRTVQATMGPSETPLPLELTNFLLDRPDLSAFIVARRGIAPYRVELVEARRSLVDDGEGVTGEITLVETGETRRVYYGEGINRSALFPDIRASAVIVMDLRPGTDAAGRPTTTTTFSVWVRMRSRFVAGVVKTLRPFLRATVVRKFSKAFLVADQVGRLMAKDPASVLADADAFPALDPRDRAMLADLMSRLRPEEKTP
jgi:hypothetical protein